MQPFSLHTIEALAKTIAGTKSASGEDQSIGKYRSGTEIERFFTGCGFDFQLNGLSRYPTLYNFLCFHDEVGDSFSEKIFKGPIHLQLKEALRYLQSMFIKEEVRKRPDRAEADRFYNYPYVALEEALANAVYHKDYAQREPIEISISQTVLKFYHSRVHFLL